MRKTCRKADGTPKHAYETVEDAMSECMRHNGTIEPYKCKQHGYHVGGKVTRGLRKRLRSANARRAA